MQIEWVDGQGRVARSTVLAEQIPAIRRDPATPGHRGRRPSGGSGMADGSGGTVGSGRAGELRAALALLGRIEATIDAARMEIAMVLEQVEVGDDSEMPLDVLAEAAADGLLDDTTTRADREAAEDDCRDLLVTERALVRS